jgi:GNAT superfamily N-acetyltransferase
VALATRTLWTLRRYWADRLGVDRAAFDSSGVTVGLGSTGGVEIFERDDALAIGAPELLVEPLRGCTDDFASIDVTDPEAACEILVDLGSIEAVLGPAFYGYVDRETFTPIESSARTLTAADSSAYERFRAAVPDAEWEQGGSGFEPGETIGVFVGGELVAVAGCDLWDDLLAHLAVVTHPEHRGEGYGRVVVSRATDRALTEGYFPQYRTLEAWPWSVALARELGFERFATSMLVLIDTDESTEGA